MLNFEFAEFPDFIFNLISSKSLVVEDLADLAAVVPKVCVAEVSEACDCEKQNQVRVVQLSLTFEGIITQLIAIRFIMDVRLILKIMTTWCRSENMDVAEG
jgi:predicted Kef-type K+ transport protein